MSDIGEAFDFFQVSVGAIITIFVGIVLMLFKAMITRTNDRLLSLEAQHATLQQCAVTREELRIAIERLENRSHSDIQGIHSRLDQVLHVLAANKGASNAG